MEQEELDDRLRGADRVPIHTPASPVGQTNGASSESPFFTLRQHVHFCYECGCPSAVYESNVRMSILAKHLGVQAQAEEDDEEAALRRLQAEFAM